MNANAAYIALFLLTVVSGSALCAILGWRFGRTGRRVKAKCFAVSFTAAVGILITGLLVVLDAPETNTDARKLRSLAVVAICGLALLSVVAGWLIALMAANISSRRVL